jgi:predicted RNase H-like HicB family nuclease
VISRYVDRALRAAHYSPLEDGGFCATVPALRGVIATGSTVEKCRDELSEVVEEWALLRVARGLAVPAIGSARIQIRKAS